MVKTLKRLQRYNGKRFNALTIYLTIAIRNSLIRWEIEYGLEKFQPRNQSRQPFLLPFVIELAETLICFAFASFAVGELVGGETPVVGPRSGQCRRLGEELRGVLVIFVFLFVKTSERFVEIRAIGIIFYPALKKIFPETEILALCFDPQRQTLQSRDVPEQQQHTTPFRALPRDMRLDEEPVGDDRSKSAQGGYETELPEFFAKIEIKLDAPKMFLSMARSEVALDWQFDRPDREQCYHDQ